MGSTAQAQTIDYQSLEELFGEAVTTSATGKPQRAPDVPVTMEILTDEDIRRSPATDIPGVLRHVGGMSVWQWTRTYSDVSVRGNNEVFSPRLLVLVNGRQVYTDDYGHVAWETIPVQLEEIRQIEIVKGPNSALFGFNAVGGVVNIITYNPLYDDVSSAGVRVGTDDYKQGHFLHTIQGENYGMRLSGGRMTSEDFDSPAGFDYEDPDQWSFAVDSVFEVTDSAHLRLEVNKSALQASHFIPSYAPSSTRHGTESAKLSLAAEAGPGMFEATVYHNISEKKGLDPTFPLELDNSVTVAQAEYLFPFSVNHDFQVLTEYRHNSLTGSNVVPDGSEVYYDLYAAGGMWNWRLRDNLSWTNAIRVDHLDMGRSGPLLTNALVTSNEQYNKRITEIAYNSGLVWHATPHDTLRLSTARGVQAPSLWDFGQMLDFGPVTVVGNPGIDASVIKNYEIGYDRRIDQISGQLRTSVFYQEIKDIKGPDNVNTVGTSIQPDNIGDSSTIGAEIGLEGLIGTDWNWDANYMIQHVDDKLTVNQGGTTTVGYDGEDATPTHTLNGHLGYTKGAWEVDGYARYVTGYKVLRGISPYSEVDAGSFLSLSGRVAYNVNENITLALSGQQLNHEDVRETSAPGRERQVFLSVNASF
ncbi:MAG: TonB-dependent receptor plug domain-containing protein [Pseudomonadota bacterium]